jgi:hypothetical protein
MAAGVMLTFTALACANASRSLGSPTTQRSETTSTFSAASVGTPTPTGAANFKPPRERPSLEVLRGQYLADVKPYNDALATLNTEMFAAMDPTCACLQASTDVSTLVPYFAPFPKLLRDQQTRLNAFALLVPPRAEDDVRTLSDDAGNQWGLASGLEGLGPHPARARVVAGVRYFEQATVQATADAAKVRADLGLPPR